MSGVHPHRPPTTLDVMEQVLAHRVVVDTRSDDPDTRGGVSVVGLRVLGVNVRVITTDLE